MNKNTMFDRYIQAVENTMDITLRWWYQKNMMKSSIFESQEKEQLINEVAERVLSRISATVDAEEVFNKIDELQEKIDSLKRK